MSLAQSSGEGSTRGNPIAIGDVGRVRDFDVQVLGVTFEAEGSTTGPAPAPGNQFVVARIGVRYDGAEPDTIDNSLGLNAVGDANLGYSPYYHGCAVDDGTETVGTLEQGDTAEFNVCWEVTDADATTLVMYVKRFYTFDDPVWFSLGKDGAAGHDGAALGQATPALIATSSRETPIPLGSRGRVGEVEIAVEAVIPDAGPVLAETFPGHQPPEPGRQFFMVTVAITNVGPDIAIAQSQMIFGSIGASDTEYTELSDSCGLIPNGPDKVRDTLPGGTARYNLCWEIDQADAGSLVLYANLPFATDDSGRVWFALQE
jgi:hypothetical protein